MPSILRVALPVPLPTLFDYAAGDAAVEVGGRVRVPFGRRSLVGIVVERAEQTAEPDRLKAIDAVLDETPLLGGELLATLRWAARYYQHPIGEVLFNALPTALRQTRALPAAEATGWQLGTSGHAALDDPKRRRGTRIDALLAALAERPLSAAQARELAGAAAVRTAVSRGWIEAAHIDATRVASPGHALNAEQQAAADAVLAADGFAPFLLDGVTGSGKTEVYLAIARAALARGRQALVLVPEIALTPQAVRRFRDALGVDIAVLHSGLGESERARAWLAASRGEAGVVLGTRSAVFVPLARPGAIVVDEEHDTSYKQHEGFRYHARDLAVVRAKALDVPVVLGSATPSLESLANVEAGRYQSLRLTERAGGAQPPSFRVVDLRHQRLQHGLAQPTLAAIEACLARGEQALVFRNRRGYAPVLLCHDCGWSARCPDCDRAMTLHRRERVLRCHHCDVRQSMPSACPQCGSLALNPLGEGTERLEDALAERFPTCPSYASTATPRAAGARARRCSTACLLTARACSSARRCSRKATTSRDSRSSSWSASTKGCTASISAPANASRNSSCKSPDAPAARATRAKSSCKPTIPRTRCCAASSNAATPPSRATCSPNAAPRRCRRMRRWRCCARKRRRRTNSIRSSPLLSLPHERRATFRCTARSPRRSRAAPAHCADRFSSKAKAVQRCRRSCRHGSTRCARYRSNATCAGRSMSIRWICIDDPS
jgi:primosomal protein N'